MEKVKLLICDLWMELCLEALENDIPKKEMLSQKQKKFIRDKIFSFLMTAANPDSLPLTSGKAFHIGWKNCTISYNDIAKRLNKQFEEENKKEKIYTEGDIKGYIFYVRDKISKRVRKASEDFNWNKKLKKIK
jgi:hypothetical protein